MVVSYRVIGYVDLWICGLSSENSKFPVMTIKVWQKMYLGVLFFPFENMAHILNWSQTPMDDLSIIAFHEEKSSCLKFGENGHFLKMSQIGLKLAWDDCPIQPIMNQGGRVQNCNVQKFCVKMLYYTYILSHD